MPKQQYHSLSQNGQCARCGKYVLDRSHHIFQWKNTTNKYSGLFCVSCGKYYEKFNTPIQIAIEQNNNVEYIKKILCKEYKVG